MSIQDERDELHRALEDLTNAIMACTVVEMQKMIAQGKEFFRKEENIQADPKLIGDRQLTYENALKLLRRLGPATRS